MKQIGIISVTLNAVNPLMDQFMRRIEDYHVKNYLDEGLQALVQQEGRVTDKSIARMVALINKAGEDGADALLLTCTVFTPYVGRLQQLFDIPIIGADDAMLKQVAEMNQRTAILCTFPATVHSSTEIYNYYADKFGIEKNMDIFLLEDAAAAIKRSDKEEHNQIIANKAMILAKDYDLIVLAQMSMAQAALLLEKCPKPVFTSPSSAIHALDLL